VMYEEIFTRGSLILHVTCDVYMSDSSPATIEPLLETLK